MQHNKFAPIRLAVALHFTLLDDLARAVDDDDDREVLRLVSGIVGYIDGFYEGAMSL